jgi:hypothetical protein
MADAADAALTASGAAPSQDPTDSAILPQAAGALSPTLASIAGLPAVPVFLSTAQVLGAAPAASKRRAAAQTEAHPQAAEIAPITVKSAARKKPARAAADEPAAPAVSTRKRKPAEAIVVPVAVNRSRRKASASARPPSRSTWPWPCRRKASGSCCSMPIWAWPMRRSPLAAPARTI